jgi:hypothetical protein
MVVGNLCPSALLSATDPTWTALASNTDFQHIYVFLALRHDMRILTEIFPKKLRLFPKICYTGYTQKNGAVSKVNKKFISHLTPAQRTPSALATVQVSHALITVLQCVHPGSHDTHPHGNQIHPRLGVACPL